MNSRPGGLFEDLVAKIEFLAQRLESLREEVRALAHGGSAAPDLICGAGAVPVKSAAAFLGVCPDVVRDLINDRTLPHVRVGVRVLVPKAALIAFLRSKLAETDA